MRWCKEFRTASGPDCHHGYDVPWGQTKANKDQLHNLAVWLAQTCGGRKTTNELGELMAKYLPLYCIAWTEYMIVICDVM